MSTNKAYAKYQEIYDIQTVSNKVGIIAIHTPTGSKPRQMLSGFFTQFRKYKYNGCSVVATPAQRLGLTTPQLSTAAGDAMVNPKDVFNPALVRGCHGDNLNAALNSIYKGSFATEGSSIGMDDYGSTVVPADGLTWEQMYYRMLQDPSFKKFSLSSGIKLSGLHPMVYNVASNHQILPSEGSAAVGQIVTGSGGDSELGFSESTRLNVTDGTGTGSVRYPQLMTNRLQSLGWMDTKQVINPGADPSNTPSFTVLPKIFMSLIVLPPALSENVRTSMRFVVTHYFSFKEFNTSLTLQGASEYYDWLVNASSKDVKNETFETNGVDDSIELVNDAVY